MKDDEFYILFDDEQPTLLIPNEFNFQLTYFEAGELKIKLQVASRK